MASFTITTLHSVLLDCGFSQDQIRLINRRLKTRQQCDRLARQLQANWDHHDRLKAETAAAAAIAAAAPVMVPEPSVASTVPVVPAPPLQHWTSTGTLIVDPPYPVNLDAAPPAVPQQANYMVSW